MEIAGILVENLIQHHRKVHSNIKERVFYRVVNIINMGLMTHKNTLRIAFNNMLKKSFFHLRKILI